jgi:hypothetical protein
VTRSGEVGASGDKERGGGEVEDYVLEDDERSGWRGAVVSWLWD